LYHWITSSDRGFITALFIRYMARVKSSQTIKVVKYGLMEYRQNEEVARASATSGQSHYAGTSLPENWRRKKPRGKNKLTGVDCQVKVK
jgi:hypothetical protein